ncbi:Holliday junction branch migration protein RuvA [Acuticoccus sp.]|uniref:Holliday junction branch migration protein RuvA n=1 Tax=Acuticoccus sp. TaxID=1904378 RepID=UPI003B51D2DB
MIGRLDGTVVETGDGVIVLDVAGVGYEVFMTNRDIGGHSVGKPATLVIETLVREDMIRLYGFRDRAHREWFRLLQGVPGVGAKVALGVLSVLPAEALAAAVVTGDRAAIARAPGVGKRVAERIVSELAGKGPTPAVTIASGATPTPSDDGLADAVSALVNLGYAEADARGALIAARGARPEASAAELIRAGLRALAA